jgi:hypothetical protein
MATDIIIAEDNSSNTSLQIYDSTDYASISSSINNVNAVRWLFATYDSINSASQVGILTANYEYTVISGTFTMNGIDYIVGDVFVPYEDFTLPTSGVTVYETGYYSTFNQYTPSTVTYFEFFPSDLAETGTTFADNARTVRYEVYDTIVLENNDLLAETYIVQGTFGDYVTLVGGEIYYVGQTFIPIAGDQYSATGNAYAVQQLAIGTFDFWTNANSSVIYQDYINSLSNRTLNASQDFKDNFIATHTNYSLPYIQSETASTYDFSQVQASLDVIVNYLGVKNKIIK